MAQSRGMKGKNRTRQEMDEDAVPARVETGREAVTMTRHHLRQRGETLLYRPDIPEPLDRQALCTALAEQRRRPLILQALPEPTRHAPERVWLALDSEDVALIKPTTTPRHRERIVLYGLGHLLCEPATSAPPTYTQRRLFRGLAPGMAARVLGRTSYTGPQEQDAETVASLIQSRSSRLIGPNHRLPAVSGSTDVLGRLPRALSSATAE